MRSSLATDVSPIPRAGTLMMRAQATSSAGFATRRRYATRSFTSLRSKNAVPRTMRYGTWRLRSASSITRLSAFMRYSTAISRHGVPAAFDSTIAFATSSASRMSMAERPMCGFMITIQ